jgi:hypothetical protein
VTRLARQAVFQVSGPENGAREWRRGGEGHVTRLTVTHRELLPGGWFLNVVASGWPIILSSLKSLIETGRPLEFSSPDVAA